MAKRIKNLRHQKTLQHHSTSRIAEGNRRRKSQNKSQDKSQRESQTCGIKLAIDPTLTIQRAFQEDNPRAGR
jgi:hypothetical protein